MSANENETNKVSGRGRSLTLFGLGELLRLASSMSPNALPQG
jgi:hypothetical protein